MVPRGVGGANFQIKLAGADEVDGRPPNKTLIARIPHGSHLALDAFVKEEFEAFQRTNSLFVACCDQRNGYCQRVAHISEFVVTVRISRGLDSSTRLKFRSRSGAWHLRFPTVRYNSRPSAVQIPRPTLAKCVKELLYKTVRARLGTRPPPDRMNTESLRRWSKRLTDQSSGKALGKQQTAWSDT